jgi:hypothetical protein
MTLAGRTAFASAAAGAGSFALLLAGRFSGTLATLLILALAIRAAGGAAAGEDDASFKLQAFVVPAWAIAIAAAAYRAGSGALVDVRGAHAVAGLSVARGPALTVVGCGLCLAGLICAIAVSAPAKRSLVSAAPRLAMLGSIAQVALAVAAFIGPAVAEPVDAASWIGGAAGVAIAAGAIRNSLAPKISLPAANLLALVGLVLVVVGGRP